MCQETILDLLIRLEAFKKNIPFFVQQSTFCQGLRPRFWVKNDHIFNSAFFYSGMSLGISTFRKSLLRVILKCI